MIRNNRSRVGLVLAASTVLLGAPTASAAEVRAEAVLADKCGSCHQPNAAGTQNRIGAARKTPEGWAMTVDRMQRWHGVELSDAEVQAVVKHLADRQGLAPEEAAPYRYVLERRPGTVEAPDDADLAATCARCHSYARVGLQRRDAGDWTKLAHMHLGQWPTMEYQAMARDRQYWTLLSTEVPAKLAGKWPLATDAWAAWSKRQPVDLSGRWRVAGHRPGKGDYSGTLTVTRGGGDRYVLAYDVVYADGGKMKGEGSSVVYTGYEWRGSVRLGQEAVDEVYAVSADGRSMAGRWFLPSRDAVGADVKAVREDHSAILAVVPPFVKAGTSSKVTVIGSALSGAPDFGPGITVEKVVAADAGAVTVQVKAAKDAGIGVRRVQVGTTVAPVALAVYDKVDRVKVEPEMTIARIGGNGGPIAPDPAQLEAVAYMNGPDGKPGTDDDVRIGPMPAKWTVADFDEAAVEAKDAKFGGVVDKSGLFMPAQAGLNPKRGPLLNNFANLSIDATVADGSAKVKGSGHLIVAPPRWVDAPIR